jgi:hypothetical protein
VESPVGTARNDVLLGEHLDRIGEAVKQAQHAKSKNAGPVGPDAVLNQGRLLPLDPGMKAGEVQNDEENEQSQHKFDQEHFDHGGVAPAALGLSFRGIEPNVAPVRVTCKHSVPTDGKAIGGSS